MPANNGDLLAALVAALRPLVDAEQALPPIMPDQWKLLILDSGGIPAEICVGDLRRIGRLLRQYHSAELPEPPVDEEDTQPYTPVYGDS